jgi:WD40 repeat protein
MPGRARRILGGHRPQPGREDLRTFEWRYLARQVRDESLHTFPDQQTLVTCLAFSPDGRLMATSDFRGEIKLWDVSSRTQAGALEGHSEPVIRVAFSPDGRLLASSAFDRTVRLWDVAARRQIARIPTDLPRDELSPISFSPDGRFLAVGNYTEARQITVWSLADAHRPRPVIRLPGVTHPLFSPDGRTLAAVSSWGKVTIQIWDVAAWRKRAQRELPLPVGEEMDIGRQFSPDGKTLALAHIDGSISLWDSDLSGRPTVLKANAELVRSVAFSRDGKTLAAAHADGMVRLWDVAGGRERAALRGHLAWVEYLAYSPDGKTLASSGGRLDQAVGTPTPAPTIRTR